MASSLSLKSNRSRATIDAASYRMASTAPRIQHFEGDVPPALSPLDAIAAHSRRLAEELKETRKSGERRMSRLPPQVVVASMSEHQANRPQIFRSLSHQTENGSRMPEREESGNSPEVAQPRMRPMSSYPRICQVAEATQEGEEKDNYFQMFPENTTYQDPQIQVANNYFSPTRTASPERLQKLDSRIRTLRTRDQDNTERQSTTSQPDLTSMLVSPGTVVARQSKQLKLRRESSDDDFTSSNAGSTFSQHRRSSSNSAISMSRSSVSPHATYYPRSPSTYSSASEREQRRSQSNLNFSRPISAASLSQLKTDSPSQCQSGNFQTLSVSPNPSFDSPVTPTSFDENRSETSEGHVAGLSASYTYGKYSLPRGRKILRDSAIFSGLSTPHFVWAEPMFPSTPPLGPISEKDIDTPSLPPKRARGTFGTGARLVNREDLFEYGGEQNIALEGTTKAPSISEVQSLDNATTSARQRSADYSALSISPNAPQSDVSVDIKSISSHSQSTIRPPTVATNSSYQALSLEDHVSKAIELHQHGDLKESTYHLRIAAQQSHPTGMLLYALAYRHGWGMRSNQKEGVQWLRKAVDRTMLEVADDEDSSTAIPVKDASEKNAHRARFALSIYELGVSHLNGWGIEQDKALALRCFEVAGSWGDIDALTEAGFCYTQGIGCKKDLHKAAKLYRTAGAKGASMVGNSWIYKEKYDEKNKHEKKSGSRGNDSKPDRKARDRSKSIFARKRSIQL